MRCRSIAASVRSSGFDPSLLTTLVLLGVSSTSLNRRKAAQFGSKFLRLWLSACDIGRSAVRISHKVAVRDPNIRSPLHVLNTFPGRNHTSAVQGIPIAANTERVRHTCCHKPIETVLEVAIRAIVVEQDRRTCPELKNANAILIITHMHLSLAAREDHDSQQHCS